MSLTDFNSRDDQHATQGGYSFKRLIGTAILKCIVVSASVAVFAWLSVLFLAITGSASLGANYSKLQPGALLLATFPVVFPILFPAVFFLAAVEPLRRSRWLNVIAGLCMAPLSFLGFWIVCVVVVVYLNLMARGSGYLGTPPPLGLTDLINPLTILSGVKTETVLACLCLTVPLCLAAIFRLERLDLRRQILMVVTFTLVITGGLLISSALQGGALSDWACIMGQGSLWQALFGTALCCLLGATLPVAFCFAD